MHRTKVKVVEGVLDANDTIAAANRADFDRAGVTVVNLMSAPGAGKTSLLERALERPLGDGIRVGVLEGDVQGSLDADRLASLHVPVTQLNTDAGFGGECSASWTLDDAGFRCPRCAAANVAVESGNEFEVESIEVEEPACTG